MRLEGEAKRQQDERRCPKCGRVAGLSTDGNRIYCHRCKRRWHRSYDWHVGHGPWQADVSGQASLFTAETRSARRTGEPREAE